MFSARVHIILIPSINEYEAAGLASFLWWNDDDYKDFKQSALNEVKDFMIVKSINDSKEAIRILYQEIYSNELEKIVEREEENSNPNPLLFNRPMTNYDDKRNCNNAGYLLATEVRSEKCYTSVNEESSHLPSMECKHYDDGSHTENFSATVRPMETEYPFSKDTNHRGGMIVIHSDEFVHSQKEVDPDVPSFATKTDVEMIHDKTNELSTKDSVSKLHKLHPTSSSTSDRLLHSSAHSSNSAAAAAGSSIKEGAAISPLALICS
jgi:hypothetical protein